MCPSLFFLDGNAAASNKRHNVSTSPRLDAKWIGAQPSLPTQLGSAPLANKNETVSAYPLRHAANNGVSPSEFFQLTSAPISYCCNKIDQELENIIELINKCH